MSKQVYAGIPGNNIYNQNMKLIQYNSNVNPLDPLGLQGMQYTVANPSNYLNKNINPQNVNQAYSKQAQAQINQYKLQNMYANNNVNPTHFQQILQPQAQKQQTQKILAQIQQMNQHHHQQPQTQIKPVVNQKPNNTQQQQQIKQVANQKPNNIQQQQQIKQVANQKQNNIQQQQQIKQVANQKQNNIQQQQINQKQKVQTQTQGQKPNDLGYQKYVQRFPPQNQNQKVNIEYNKNDQHFVNKPIYDMRKVPANPMKVQVPQNGQKQVNTLPQNIALNRGAKIGNNYNNQIISQKQVSALNNTNVNNKKLSTIKEEEINIKQSGLSSKISQISNKTDSVKEFPMEEKTPEVALPNDLMENNSQHNITQKSITDSGISDFDANLSHLPTIGSIMKGNSEPLPPAKIKKYGK